MPREYGAQRRSYLGWLRLMSITAAGLVFVVGCSTVEDPEATDAESAEVSETNADEEVNGDEDTDAENISLDTSLFADGAIVSDIVTVDCALSDGTESSCHEFTIPGFPADNEIGPFCPSTVEASTEEGGIWVDGENFFEVDGAFFAELAEIYGDEEWNRIYNEDGTINSIDDAESFTAAARPSIGEEFWYNCIDGKIEWLDGGEPFEITVQIPVVPTQAEAPTEIGGHGFIGVSLDGVQVMGSADIEAVLGAYTIAAMDDCAGHINPFEGYHLHGATDCSATGDAPEGETAPFAYAADGYTIHTPTDAATAAELDECNGHTTDEFGYHYHASELAENNMLPCLTGVTSTAVNLAGPQGGAAPDADVDEGAPDGAGGPPEDGAGGPPPEGEQ